MKEKIEKELKFIEFIKEFEQNYQYLIKDTNCKFNYSIEYNDSFPFSIHCSKLFQENINIITKYYDGKFILGCGILENRGLIKVTITQQ